MTEHKILTLDDYEHLSNATLEKIIAATSEHELDLPDGSKQVVEAEHIRQLIEAILRVREYEHALTLAQQDVIDAKKRIKK